MAEEIKTEEIQEIKQNLHNKADGHQALEISRKELTKIHERMMYVEGGLKEVSEVLLEKDQYGLAGLCEGMRELLQKELNKLEGHYL